VAHVTVSAACFWRQCVGRDKLGSSSSFIVSSNGHVSCRRLAHQRHPYNDRHRQRHTGSVGRAAPLLKIPS